MESVLVGMFDTREAAEAARTQLLGAGLAPGPVTAGSGGGATSSGSTSTSTAGGESEGTIARFFHSIFGEDGADADEHRSTYGEAFRRGGYALTVSAMDDAQIDKAESILNSAGAVDVDERSSQWRSEGWSGGAAGATGAAKNVVPAAGTAAAGGATQTFQEVQEELKVGKRAVARGGVRVFSRVREVPVEESVTLREEHATIQRRTVDRPATEADFAAFKEGELEVREMAEEAVVGKTARVVGEVEVGKVATERQETVRDTVRRTEVEVEQLGTTGAAGSLTGVGASGSKATSTKTSASVGGATSAGTATGTTGTGQR